MVRQGDGCVLKRFIVFQFRYVLLDVELASLCLIEAKYFVKCIGQKRALFPNERTMLLRPYLFNDDLGDYYVCNQGELIELASPTKKGALTFFTADAACIKNDFFALCHSS